MIYLSELLGAKVRDSADEICGQLKDILVMPREGQHAPIEFLLVKLKKDGEVFIPYSCIETFGRQEVTLKHLWCKIQKGEPTDAHIYLNRDVLDQQIVDVAGARVVRVNDLEIGLVEGQMCALGIDISFKGLLRRLNLDWLDIFDVLKVHVIDWRKAQPVKGTLKLDTISKNLKKLHPADLANIIEDLNLRQGSDLVKTLDAESAAQVVEELNPELQKILIKYLGPDKAAGIIDKMSIDEVADLLKTMTKREAKKFSSYLKRHPTFSLEKLISYPNDTAGGLMTTDFVSARPEWTVEQTIEEVKKRSPFLRTLLYVYVTDENGFFKGKVSLRHLLINEGGQTLEKILKEHQPDYTLRVDQHVSQIMDIMTKYNLFTAAVLDNDGRMAGLVTVDDVMRHIVPNA